MTRDEKNSYDHDDDGGEAWKGLQIKDSVLLLKLESFHHHHH